MKLKYILPILFISGINVNASEGQDSLFTINFLWSVVNFFLLLYVLYYANKKYFHIGDFIKSRKAKFEKEVEEATKERIAAEKKYNELVARKNNLEKEIIALKNQAMAQIEVQRKVIEENARAVSERIKKEAEMITEAEILKMKKEIRDEIIDLATKKAIEIIKEKFSPEDQERMEKEFISEIRKRKIV